MWKMVMKLIDYKIHYYLFANINTFLDMWQKADKEKNAKIEQPSIVSKLQDTMAFQKNWSAGATNQVVTQSLDYQDPFAPSRPKTPQQRSFGGFPSMPVSSNIVQQSIPAKGSSSAFASNYPSQSRYDPTSKHQHYNTQQPSFLTTPNATQDSSLNELNTFTQKKIEYSVLNEHNDFVIIKSNRTFTLRLQNKNDFDWDYSLMLELQGVINRSIKLNRKIHPGETLSLTINDIEETAKDGKIVLYFKGKDEIEKIKYYSERFNDFSIRFV
jgi:hypothetical protein